MIEYKVVESIKREDLYDKVNTHLKEGWVLQGNTHYAVAVLGGSVKQKYIQTMTRETGYCGRKRR